MNNQTRQIRAAMYLRVSTEDQTEKYGLDLQQAAIEGIFTSKGQLENGEQAMILAGEQYIYKDEGISGTTTLDERPAFLRMKEDIENPPDGAKPFDIVAVYRIDRFARRLRILLDVIDYFEQYDIQFISANESIDTSTPFGKAMLGIIGVIAELEIETTKARTQAGRKQARNQGVYMGAHAPYGYKKNATKQLIIFEEEAEIVREIFDLFIIEKKNTQQIADYLASKKVLTPLPSAIFHGKRAKGNNKVNEPTFWRDGGVLDIIKDEVYIGLYYFNKSKNKKRIEKAEWELSPYRHEPLIERVTFELAQRRIREEVALRNSVKTADNHLYLLSGLLKCQACYDPYSDRDPINWSGTSKVIDKNSGKRAYYYHCGAKNAKKHSVVCSAIPFPADEIELFVTDFIKDLLSDPKSVYNHASSLESTKASKKHLERQMTHLIRELNGIPERREALKHQHEEGYLKTPEFDERMEKAGKRETELNKELAGIEYQISEGKLSDIYTRTLKVFAKRYKAFLEGKMKDRQEIFELIHILVDRINVYTRKATKKDKVAGRKKDDQKIPYQIRIDLRLPQDIMVRLAKEGKFEVRNDNL
jgi:site-specific DNA recombinase